jgi:hypothetical protein
MWVLASGHGTLSYQWKKNGVPIAGETSNILSLADVTVYDTALYSVTIENSVSTVDSAEAIVTAGNQISLGASRISLLKPGAALVWRFSLEENPQI